MDDEFAHIAVIGTGMMGPGIALTPARDWSQARGERVSRCPASTDEVASVPGAPRRPQCPASRRVAVGSASAAVAEVHHRRPA